MTTNTSGALLALVLLVGGGLTLRDAATLGAGAALLTGVATALVALAVAVLPAAWPPRGRH